jgi:hypothetical protein
MSSTTAPQPQQEHHGAGGIAEPEPFDPFGFPSGLVTAARDAAEAREELRRYAVTLPWSREPHPGWEAPEQTGGMGGYRTSRPATDGWSEDQQARYDTLWEKWRETSALVYTHEHWGRCGAKAYEARQALKRLPEAQPVVNVEAGQPAQEDAALAS